MAGVDVLVDVFFTVDIVLHFFQAPCRSPATPSPAYRAFRATEHVEKPPPKRLRDAASADAGARAGGA